MKFRLGISLLLGLVHQQRYRGSNSLHEYVDISSLEANETVEIGLSFACDPKMFLKKFLGADQPLKSENLGLLLHFANHPYIYDSLAPSALFKDKK